MAALSHRFQLDDLQVDLGQQLVTRDGTPLQLPKLSFDLLVALAKAAPNLVSIDELMSEVWPGLIVNPETVAQRIKLLRDALGDDPRTPRYIESLRSRGYRLLPSVRTRPSATAQSTIPEKSIAVLPFIDMSEKKDQEFFSDGLSEELIYLLSKIADLRVPARTSSFYFKGKSEDIAAIAQKLRVAHVLEGSVRKAGNHLRVTAKLIRAEDGYHLWSETYDRDLKDVFKVQDEIAAAVVTALKLKLASLQPTSSRHTSNIEAYNEVLLAREYFHRNTLDGFRRAGDAARKAVALDPNYAEAYSLLAYAEYVVGALREGDPAGLAKAKAMAIADKAVALAPDQAYGYAARGYIRFNSWEWAGAQADYKEALTIDPGEAATQPGYATLLASLGRLPEAIAAMRKACELDPLAGNPWNKLLHFLTSSRDFVAAEEAMNHALEVAPESPSILWNSANLVQLKGNTREALMMFRKIDVESNRLSGIAIAEYSLGNAKESQQAVDELIAKHAQDSACFIALVHAWRGEKDKAFEWLERAFQRHAFNLTWIKFDWSFDSLRDDPRYKALLHKMNLPE